MLASLSASPRRGQSAGKSCDNSRLERLNCRWFGLFLADSPAALSIFFRSRDWLDDSFSGEGAPVFDALPRRT